MTQSIQFTKAQSTAFAIASVVFGFIIGFTLSNRVSKSGGPETVSRSGKAADRSASQRDAQNFLDEAVRSKKWIGDSGAFLRKMSIVIDSDQSLDPLAREKLYSEFRSWLVSDPDRAARWFVDRPVEWRREFLSNLNFAPFPEEAAFALVKALREKSEETEVSEKLISKAFPQLDRKEQDEILTEWTDSLSGENLGVESLLFQSVERLSKKDPGHALHWLSKFAETGMDANFIRDVVGDIARRDREIMSKFLKDVKASGSLSDSNYAYFFQESMKVEWPTSGPATLDEISLWNEMTSLERSATLGAIAETDVEAAWRLASGLSIKTRLELALHDEFTASKLLEIKTEIEGAIREGDEIGGQNLVGVITYFSENDPDFARRVMSELPDGADKLEAFRTFAIATSKRDAVLASEWLMSLTEGEYRDAAVMEFVNEVPDDVGASIEWVSTISDPEKRADTYKLVLNRIRIPEGSVMEHELLNRGMSVEEIASILQEIK